MIQISEETASCIRQAMRVDFLTERWEFEQYITALILATQWSKKIDQQNKEYFSKNHLIDKYNV